MGAYETNRWHFKVLSATSCGRRTQQNRPSGGYCSWSLMWQRLDDISVSANSLLSVVVLCLSSLNVFCFPQCMQTVERVGICNKGGISLLCWSERRKVSKSPVKSFLKALKEKCAGFFHEDMSESLPPHAHARMCAHTRRLWCMISYTKHLSPKPDWVTHVRIAQVEILRPVEKTPTNKDCRDDKLISELCLSFKLNSGDSVPVECVWEPRGRRLVFIHDASFRWVGTDTGRISTHCMTDRRRLSHLRCKGTQEPDTIC